MPLIAAGELGELEQRGDPRAAGQWLIRPTRIGPQFSPERVWPPTRMGMPHVQNGDAQVR